jgi:hypothetical protein
MQDVEHQPCFSTPRPLRPVAGHVFFGPGNKATGLAELGQLKTRFSPA